MYVVRITYLFRCTYIKMFVQFFNIFNELLFALVYLYTMAALFTSYIQTVFDIFALCEYNSSFLTKSKLNTTIKLFKHKE